MIAIRYEQRRPIIIEVKEKFWFKDCLTLIYLFGLQKNL